MKAVHIPDDIIEIFLDIERACLEDGNLGWGEAYESDWREAKLALNLGTYDDVFIVPVNSNGAGQFIVLYLWKLLHNVQTYDADYTIPGLYPMYRSLLHPDPNPHVRIRTPLGGVITQQFIDSIPPDAQYILIDGAHIHYLEREMVDILRAKRISRWAIVVSYFATKNIPIGEGALIITNDEALYQKLKRVLMYKDPDFNINLRMRVPDYRKIIQSYTDETLIDWFYVRRRRMFGFWDSLFNQTSYAIKTRWKVLHYNGYKYIAWVNLQNTPLKDYLSSRLPIPYEHDCPATYPHLTEHLDELENVIKEVHL